MALPERPEPMDAISHHPKLSLSIALSDPTFLAGKYLSAKMEMQSRADKGLGIGLITVELFGIQELSSRDHSATSTFLRAQRLFQGPGLPPSNAVQAHAEPGDPPLPSHHYHARRGISTFLFRIPLPITSPSSINFGGGLATVKYELRASASVYWRGEKKLVTERKVVDVVQGLDDEDLTEYLNGNDATSIAVGENGKMWMQGTIVGSRIITAGESVCVELQVKNHSSKKNTGLTLSLTRQLVLPKVSSTEKQPLQITDTLTTVAFRGPEYIIQPGVEGVANLVFDIPKDARGVKGGAYEDEGDHRPRVTPSIFQVQCIVSIKMSMGIGNKDLVLDIPMTIVNPLAVPEELIMTLPPEHVPPIAPVDSIPYTTPSTYPESHAYSPYHSPITPPPATPLSPQLSPMFSVADPNRVWLPPLSPSPLPYQYISPVNPMYPLIASPPVQILQSLPPPRPASALASLYSEPTISGLPPTSTALHPLLPLNPTAHYGSALQQSNINNLEREEGKGDRASRVSHHLHMSSRNRSTSPPSHRFPLPRSSPGHPTADGETSAYANAPSQLLPPAGEPVPESKQLGAPLHSPRPLLSPELSHSSLRSEGVEELERLAAEETGEVVVLAVSRRKKKKSSRKGKEKEVIPSSSSPLDFNKTLPPPPVPTRRGFPLTLEDANVKRARSRDRPAKLNPLPSPAPADKAPPTPTLTAVTPVRHARSNLTEKLAAAKVENGLDALERRLLAEVGTRKVERMSSVPNARGIFGGQSSFDVPTDNPPSTDNDAVAEGLPVRGRLSPIKIPAPRAGSNVEDDGLRIDSAISSLTLADGGWAMRADRRGLEEREVIPRRPLVVEEPPQDHEMDGDSDEKTHRAGTVGGKSKSKSSLSGDDGLEERQQERMQKTHGADGFLVDSEPDDGGYSRGRSREGSLRGKKGGKKKEGHKRRKSVKGRVAAWLGTIDPDALPPEDDLFGSSYTESPAVPQHTLQPERDPGTSAGPSLDFKAPHTSIINGEQVPFGALTAAPNPRSSGFMPIGTQSRESKRVNINSPVHQSSVNQATAPRLASTSIKPVQQDPNVKPHVDAKNITPSTSQLQRAHSSYDHRVKPQPGPSGRAGKATFKPMAPAPLRERQQAKLNIQSSPSLSPPGKRSDDPGIKYDPKPARGGRGGKVTAIAAFWASASATEAPKAAVPNLMKKPSVAAASERKQTAHTANTKLVTVQQVGKPIPPRRSQTALPPVPREASKGPVIASEASPKLLGLAGKSNAVAKSPSVPAIVSSSLATPMLSSTASLARPPVQQSIRPTVVPINNSATPVEVPSRSHGPSKAKSTPDLGFGKARLRDLIKKYQEQAS